MALNKRVALLFHWPELERQVMIDGMPIKTSDRISDDYFNSRLSAVISNQTRFVHKEETTKKYLPQFEHFK